jgi:hypothetical protein
VNNVEGKAYGKATGWYIKHYKYSEWWNPGHPFRSTRLSAGSVIELANKNLYSSTSPSWTAQVQDRIIPISTCPVKAPLWTLFSTQQLLFDWRRLTYLRKIIQQGYFQKYPVPFATSPIPGALQFWTDAPRWVKCVIECTQG